MRYFLDGSGLKLCRPVTEQSDLSNIIEKLSQPTNRFPMEFGVTFWRLGFFKKEIISTPLRYSGFVSINYSRLLGHYIFSGSPDKNSCEGLIVGACISSWELKMEPRIIIDDRCYIRGIEKNKGSEVEISIYPYTDVS